MLQSSWLNNLVRHIWLELISILSLHNMYNDYKLAYDSYISLNYLIRSDYSLNLCKLCGKIYQGLSVARFDLFASSYRIRFK